MRNQIWILVGLMMVSSLIMVGCGPVEAEDLQLIEIPASNINFLIGAWEISVNNTSYRLEFNQDQTILVGSRISPIVNGPFVLEGNQLVDKSMNSCDARYNVTIRLEPDAEMPGLHFELVGEDCEAGRVEALDGKTLYPLPGS